MMVMLAPTRSFAQVNGVRCRCWTGRTDAGVPVNAWLAAVMPLTIREADLNAFDEALEEIPNPLEREHGNRQADDPAQRSTRPLSRVSNARPL